jgi:hypothetical protein
VKYAIIVPIIEGVLLQRVDQFLKTLNRTDRSFHLIVVNNSKDRIDSILDKYNFSNVTVINNSFPSSYYTSISQGLKKAMLDDTYSVCVNPDKALVMKSDWLDDFSKYDNLSIGGNLYSIELTFSKEMNKAIHMACGGGSDLSWLTVNMNDKKIVKILDSNIFIVNNSSVESLGLFKNLKKDKVYDYPMIELCMRCFYKNINLTEVEEIFSKNMLSGTIGSNSEGIGIMYPISKLTYRESF